MVKEDIYNWMYPNEKYPPGIAWCSCEFILKQKWQATLHIFIFKYASMAHKFWGDNFITGHWLTHSLSPLVCCRRLVFTAVTWLCTWRLKRSWHSWHRKDVQNVWFLVHVHVAWCIESLCRKQWWLLRMFS